MQETIHRLGNVDNLLMDVETAIAREEPLRVPLAKLTLARAGIGYVLARLGLLEAEKEEPCKKS